MSQLNLALTCIAFVVIAVGLLSRRIHRWPVSKPMLALIAGFLVGPEILGLINPHEWVSPQYVLEETARLTLAIGLMAVGLRVPRSWLAKNWASPLILISAVMLMMWAASAGIIYLVIAAPLWLAALMGAVVTPTDPILAGTIVTGDLAKDAIPARIRHSLSVESGANDGLAFAAVTLGITMVNAGAGGPDLGGMAMKIAWEIGMAVLVGAALGYLAGRALQWAEQEGAIEPPVFLSFTVALSLLVLGVTALLHADDILGVFVAGIVLSLIISAYDRAREARLQEAVNQIFIVPVFLFLGAVLPFDDWVALGWPAVLLILAIMLFRRVPALLLTGPLIPATSGPVESLFVGWFGTVGVAAVYWAALAWHHTDEDLVWTVGTLIVVASIFAHGMTAAWLTCRYKEVTGFEGTGESEEDDEDPQQDVQ